MFWDILALPCWTRAAEMRARRWVRSGFGGGAGALVGSVVMGAASVESESKSGSGALCWVGCW